MALGGKEGGGGGAGQRGRTTAVPTHPTLHDIGGRRVGVGRRFLGFLSFSPFPLSISLVRLLQFLGQAWAEGKGKLARRRLAFFFFFFCFIITRVRPI